MHSYICTKLVKLVKKNEMLINVPQYIDVEDKIVGPLTAKQLGWMIALGIILMIMWSMLSKPVFFIVGLPLTVVFLGLAFYKPYGQPLGSFVIFGILYFFRPKIYFWKRSVEKKIVVQKKKVVENHLPDKRISQEELRELAKLLDSEGTEHNIKVEKILKQMPSKK